jgi:signal transduction histidine kinase
MEREAVRIRGIVSDLLGFARQAAAEAIRLDLRQVLDHALHLLEYQLLKEDIRVTRDVPGTPQWVMGDADQLLQVLMNLIQNARQAMPSGGTLNARIWSERGLHRCAISDTGSGISEASLPHIFDPFFTTKPVGQGTGLGLSVSYGIVKRHGGDIQVSSQLGVGTTFVVSLPAAREATASDSDYAGMAL